MIVLPLFWDQVDNAQRVDETGFGQRFGTYGFDDDELTGAIERLLADKRAAEADGRRSPPHPGESGTVRAADLIERVAVTGQPVHREALPA